MKNLLKTSTPNSPERLSSYTSSIFTLAFRYKLQKNYDFADLQKSDLRKFQRFLNTVSQMTFQEVEQRYRRDSDRTDVFQDRQVIHYAIDQNFRIHGIIETGQFIVLRLDPNHRFHP